MADLSSQAGAVLNAAFVKWIEFDDIDDNIPTQIAAVVLRAAAYQVAPAKPALDSCCDHHEQAIRHKLLAWAAELDGALLANGNT